MRGREGVGGRGGEGGRVREGGSKGGREGRNTIHNMSIPRLATEDYS